jgi:hypothetical protein
MLKVSVEFLFSGMGDYFGGFGCDRESQALLYACYDHRTTLRDLVDSWVDDSWSGPAGEDLPEDVTESDVRSAIMDMLSPQGLKDYDSGALAECAVTYAEVNDLPMGDDDGAFEDDDDYDDYCELPVAILLITWEDEDE